jgi:hypothetical protein
MSLPFLRSYEDLTDRYLQGAVATEAFCYEIARRAYEDKDFTLLPILADALEEGGCRDEVLLSHGRRPGPHARGCFVLDLLLQKG